jgi:hypothetical protein
VANEITLSYTTGDNLYAVIKTATGQFVNGTTPGTEEVQVWHDGVTLAGVDVSAVPVNGVNLVPTQPGPGGFTQPTLGYTSGDQLQAVVAAAQQIQQFIAGTDVNGTQTSIGSAIAAVCGS